jgi:hypothetical protein
MSESDHIFLKTFGLGFDKDKNRVAVVYLAYLNKLTPEHQNYWRNKEVNRECSMLKEYYENTINGLWTHSHSVFSAFLGEQKALNDLSKTIFGKPLFNKTFEHDNRPKEFTFIFCTYIKELP